MMECELCYVSASCNRYPNCLDFGEHLICFGSCNAIAIYDFQKNSIQELVTGHKGSVNCVRWIDNITESLIISSSVDKTSIIWQRINDTYRFKPKYTLVGHIDSVIVAYCIQLQESEFLTVSCSSDLTAKIWRNDEQLATLPCKNFTFDARLIRNSVFDCTILMIAGGDENVQLYTGNADHTSWENLIKLTGHEDWIRCLDTTVIDNDTIFVASASQDFFIRVHKITRTQKTEAEIHEKVVKIGNSSYLITLETVLAGHEGWVYGVRWSAIEGRSLQLVTASIDKTIILWEQPSSADSDDLWLEKLRVGEVGGNTLGFLGCAISKNGNVILGYSFNGALHLWQNEANNWVSGVVPSGHFDVVTDLCWEPSGEFFVTCSLDETTRLHAPWQRPNAEDDKATWHEVARPQIHGYEINCIAMIDRLSFASGADEKVLRLFRATKCFVKSAAQISQTDLTTKADEDLAECASVPALGLSNKAIYEAQEAEASFKPVALTCPPTEEVLLQNTLWPEVQKLYGHVYELYAVAVNKKCTILASACKASKPQFANVILWDLNTFKQIGQLESHQMTVTQIRFSPDDTYILTVSRDRTWALIKYQDKIERIAFSNKSTAIHSRIIWDCAWTVDSKCFVTVSRDKTALVWRLGEANLVESCLGPVVCCGQPLTTADSINTVDSPAIMFQQSYLIALGLENGDMQIYSWNESSFWNLLYTVLSCHHLPIKRLRFSSKIDKRLQKNQLYLTSCGADRAVKLHKILLKNV